MKRIEARFRQLAQKQNKALVTFVTAGDPKPEIFARLLAKLPEAGADLIEIGMPFSDPMADGPEIQLANQRALAEGVNLDKIFTLVANFRQKDNLTPIVLMGYFNPVKHYGLSAFAAKASASGVDGLIIVDLPPEEEQEFKLVCGEFDLDLLRLISTMTPDQRLAQITQDTSGFIYFISVAGTTGLKSADPQDVKRHLARIKKVSDLPVLIGFGIDSPAKAQALYPIADGIVVGSALVKTIRLALEEGLADEQIVSRVVEQVRSLRPCFL